MTAVYVASLIAAVASVVWMWWARGYRLPAEWMVPNLPLGAERALETERRRIAKTCHVLPGLSQIASVAHGVLLGITISRIVSHQPLPPYGVLWIWSGFCLLIGFLCLRAQKRFIRFSRQVEAIITSRELSQVP